MFTIARAASIAFLLALVACGGSESAAPEAGQPVAASDSSAPETPARRTLPNAKATQPGTADLSKLERIDLAPGLSTGQTKIEANDARAQQSTGNLTDGNLETLVISDQTNPLEITITLDRPVRLRAARIHPIASAYDWVLEAVPGEDRLLAQSVPEHAWSQIDLPRAVETSVVRLEVLRLERDDFVHVAEIELYAEPSQ